MNKNKKPGYKRVFVRLFPFNRLSFPILLNTWEKEQLDKEFAIIPVTDRESLTNSCLNPHDVILYSFMTPYLPLIHEEITGLKTSGALIVGGGPHISGEQELAGAVGFDVLFAGAGEHNFLEFGHDLLEDTVKPLYIYESSEEKISKANLDDFLPFSSYLDTVPPLEIMRGCAWKCQYCAANLERPRARSLDSITAYLEELQRRKLKRVNFISPSALEYGCAGRPGDNPQPGRRDRAAAALEELLKRISNYDFRFVEYGIFPAEIKPGTLTVETSRILKKYVSNRAITLGVQGSTDTWLKAMKRGHTLDAVENTIEIANAAGFLVNLDFIAGCPGETPADRVLTIQLMKKWSAKYRVKIQLHYFFPLPGSGWAFRFPSRLATAEKENFLALTRSGIARAGWVNNERQVEQYFSWLQRYFPKYYGMYRD